MSSYRSLFLLCGAFALQLPILSNNLAYGDIIILADPNAQSMPIVIDPAMRGIIMTAPAKDNPGVARHLINRAQSWSSYKGNAPTVGTYYPYTFDPNAPVEIRNRAVVDYSLRRAQSYRQDTGK